jgi:NAD(P)-dependent dehydrogenase (short-subunit alcohol dehydrogenase family)
VEGALCKFVTGFGVKWRNFRLSIAFPENPFKFVACTREQAMWGLEQKHVLITGAGGGIGRALVAAFRGAGARVTACDRDPALLDALEGVEKLAFELTDAIATSRAVALAIERQGAIDALVGNAGFTRAETLNDVDSAVWESEIAINLTGTYNIATPVLAGMKARKAGAMVFVSSVNALAHFGNPAYSAAKAGILAYARAIAVEHGRDGLRANCVCPGSVRTPAWDHRLATDPTLLDKVIPHYPLGRLVTPEEVANAVLFLASPLSAGITGTELPVDAGLTAGNLRFTREVLGG